jgi:hypothetical protein
MFANHNCSKHDLTQEGALALQIARSDRVCLDLFCSFFYQEKKVREENAVLYTAFKCFEQVWFATSPHLVWSL